jgi:ABC-2 type transport system ATP-binding protein
MQNAAIVAHHVTVQKNGIYALHDVSLAINRGMITGLIGPSGSGKTTLMRAIIGAQALTAGELTVLDKPAGSKALRSEIGYVTQSPAIYSDLTVMENLRYFATITGASRGDIRKVLKQVDLTAQAAQVALTLSGGQAARLSLSVALLGGAELLVLDEPTVGLDPVLRRELWALFTELAAEGRTLLISSHVMDEAELCPELLLLRDGQILSHGSRDMLLKVTGTKKVEDAFIKLVLGDAHAS